MRLYILFDHAVITFGDRAVVFFDPINNLSKIPFIVADDSHHLEIVLEILDLLVENHKIFHCSGIFKSLDVLLVFPNIFCIPLQNMIYIELAHPAFKLLDKLPDRRNIFFCNARTTIRPLLFSRPVNFIILRFLLGPLFTIALDFGAECHTRCIFYIISNTWS